MYMYECISDCMFLQHVCSACKGQMDLWELELKIVWVNWYKCWELNPGPLEEHQVLPTAEIPLQSFKPNFKALKTFSYNVNLSSGKVTNGKNLEENWGSGL